MGIPDGSAPYADFVSARWNALYRVAFLLTGGDADAEDLLQSTLVKAYVNWERVTSAGSAEAYVRRILVNTFVSGRRRAWTREDPVEVVPDIRVAGAEDAADDRLGLWPQVLGLPARQRAVVVLRYYEDLTLQETANVLGVSIGTAKSQASDALRALRAGLNDQEGAEPWTS